MVGHPESGHENDLHNLRDYYMASSDEVEVAIPADELEGIPIEHQQHRFEKDLGPIGKAELLRGDVTDGDELGKHYETLNLPGELAVELPELGSVTLTKVRTGLNRDSNAKGNVESRWGDGEFATLAVNLEKPGPGWTINREPHPTKEGKEHVWGRWIPTGQAAEISLDLPRLGVEPGQERTLESTSLIVKRVDMDFDADENREDRNKPRGRVKFEVRINPTQA